MNRFILLLAFSLVAFLGCLAWYWGQVRTVGSNEQRWGDEAAALTRSEEGESLAVVTNTGEEFELYSGGSYALLIGNVRYRHPAWGDLASIEGELKEVAKELKAQGFSLYQDPAGQDFHRDLSGQEMERLLDDFKRRYGFDERNRLVVFFAGHGKTLDGEGYLVGTSAPDLSQRLEFLQECMSMRRLRNLANEARSNHILFLLDCCFGGAVFNRSGNDQIPEELRRQVADPVRIFITSGGANEKVPEKSSFAPAFVRALRNGRADANGDGYVLGSELTNYLQREVAREARNKVQSAHLRAAGALDKGDVVFRNRDHRAMVSEERESPSPSRKENTLLRRAQWQESLREMTLEYQAAQQLAGITDWQEFQTTWEEVWKKEGNPYFKKGEEMLAVARERSVKPAMEGQSAGEEREFEIAPGVKMTFCWCPATTSEEWKKLSGGNKFFRMGDLNGGGESDEKEHRVVLTKGFWLGKYEVTQGQWEAVMGTNVREQRDKADPSWSLKGEGVNYPMYYVNHEEVEEFASKLLRAEVEDWEWRLPSESEWEYGCRAGSESKWHYGNSEEELGKYGWLYRNSEFRVQEVGGKGENNWGLHDMHGNLWEWCGDWYGEDPKGKAEDSAGLLEGSQRVIRGGGLGSTAAGCRSAERGRGASSFRGDDMGFRLSLKSLQMSKPKSGYTISFGEDDANGGDALTEIRLSKNLEIAKSHWEIGEPLPRDFLDAKGVSLDDIRRKALLGDADAQFLMGRIFTKNLGLYDDVEEAIKWYKKAAEQGHEFAQNNLGTRYKNEAQEEGGYFLALKYFQQSAAQGNSYGLFNLGWMYIDGKGVPQNYKKALEFLKEASEKGHQGALNDVGVMYKKGQGVNQSDEEALKWFQKAAEQGDVLGQANLGLMYKDGRGIEQDDEKAVEWYRKAVAQGDSWSEVELGKMYKLGRGVGQDDEEALRLFRKAAAKSYSWAQRELGMMYLDGLGEPQSDEEAKKWFQKAADNGDDWAKKKLEELRAKE